MSTGRIGIEALAVWLPRHYMEMETLAVGRGVDPGKYLRGLGCRRMAVPSPEEDAVVLAVEASRALFRRFELGRDSIGMAIVGTETGVDAAKPIATYVHRFADLPPDCRTFDVKHACFGGTAALRIAADWVASGRKAGRKALVVATDIARYEVGSAGEPTQGAAAVAMVVSDEPRVLALGPEPEAVHTEEVLDFWRPTYRTTAIADGHYSMACYLRAVESCYRQLEAKGDRRLADFDFLLYHAPFPAMARKAHRRLRELACDEASGPRAAEDDRDFARRVAPALWANAEVGNGYSASLYLSLAALLETEDAAVPNALLGLFSYGSGCCAELFTGRVGAAPSAYRGRTGLREALAERVEIGLETYEAFRRGQEARVRDAPPDRGESRPGLAFRGTVEERRTYRDGEARDACAPPPTPAEELGREGAGRSDRPREPLGAAASSSR